MSARSHLINCVYCKKYFPSICGVCIRSIDANLQQTFSEVTLVIVPLWWRSSCAADLQVSSTAVELLVLVPTVLLRPPGSYSPTSAGPEEGLPPEKRWAEERRPPSRRILWPWWRIWCWGRVLTAPSAGTHSVGLYSSAGKRWHTAPPYRSRTLCDVSFSSWQTQDTEIKNLLKHNMTWYETAQ